MPRLYGLPKTNKAGIPMWTVISGTGSTTDRLSKTIVKIITSFLRIINPSHTYKKFQWSGRKTKRHKYNKKK